jgi:hypothetical protein
MKPDWFTKDKEISMRKSTGRFFDRLAKAYEDHGIQDGADCVRKVAKRNAEIVRRMEK